MAEERTTPAATVTELLQGLIDGTTDLVAALDQGFRYVAFNRAYSEEFRKIFGREIRVGDSMVAALAHLPEDQANAVAIWGRALAGESFTVFQEFGDERRERNCYELRYSPIRGAGGVIGAAHIVRDVTEKRRAQEALRESEERYRTLFTSMTEGFALGEVIRDDAGEPIDFRFLEMNEAFERQSGLGREATRGRPMREVLPDLEQSWIDTYCGVALGAPSRRFERYNRDLDRHFSVYCFSPTPGRFAILFTDVTDQKRAEDAVRRSEAALDAFFAASPGILNLIDEDLRYLNADPTTPTYFGLTRETIIGKSVKDLAPGFVERFGRVFRRVLETGEPELNVETHDEGGQRPGDVTRWRASYFPVPLPGGRRAVGVMGVEITDLRRAEDALRENQERFRALADNIAQLAWMADEKGSIFWYNRRWFEYTGTTLEEMEGWGWQKVHHPDHVGRVVEKIRRCFETGEPWEDTFPLRGRDGGYRWFLSRAVPIRDAAGQVVRWFGTNTDVTEQRDADRRKDEFLAMLSHELRNPLAPIRNASFILRHAKPGGEQARRAQEVIERQTTHLTRIVDDLLDVTRIARGRIELRRERICLRDVVLRAADDFRVIMDERGIAFHIAVPPSRAWADADATRITQALGNLLHNAAKFTGRGESVALSLHAGGGVAEIRVRDTGAGIDPAVLPNVFDPFVQGERTLARTEGGLGLGLALVKGIVELHGGTVRVESDGRGMGAEFVLQLPLVEGAGRSDQPGRAVTAPGAGRRVLVVDDNRDAAESLAEIVAMLGHVVEVALDGPSALATARAARPDTVLCDLGLPGMSGYDVARALREGDAGVRLFAVSGYAQPEDVQRALEAGFDGHLAKPASIEEIERVLA